ADAALQRLYGGNLTLFKYQDAVRYLHEASQCSAIAKKFQDRGTALKGAAKAEERLDNPLAAASFYCDAARSFKKDDPQEAVVCLGHAVNLFCRVGRFGTAARLECEVARICELDRDDAEASRHLMRAADFFHAETGHDHVADRCIEQVAYNAGLAKDYGMAAELYEQLGRRCLDHCLQRFNAPALFLRSLLCTILGGHAAAVPTKAAALARAAPLFRDSREHLFAVNVAAAAAAGQPDPEALAEHAYN
ncbi:unnamed protein product, partial [Phaeothamnion confervicola]